MTKIVYNSCYGGFGLSHAAIMRYGELKGIHLYLEADPRFPSTLQYYTAPPEKRPVKWTDKEWATATIEARQEYNKAMEGFHFSYYNISRTDPCLVQVVEELSKAANGLCASLAIRDLPPGTKYRIDEYDGAEEVITIDEYDWQIA